MLQPSDISTRHAASTDGVILAIDKLSFSFEEQPLFTQLSAHVRGGVTLVRGGDGRGKSTLMRLLAGTLAPDAGELAILGIDLRAEPAAYRKQLYWREPRCEDFDQISAMAYFDSLRSQQAGFDDRALGELVEGLSLTPHIDKPLYMLSTGSKRKVWLTGAFMSGAAVTLLDGPFASLDQASINFVLTLLQGAAQQADRAWVVADYEAPAGIALSGLIDLGD